MDNLELLIKLKAVLDHWAQIAPGHEHVCNVCGPARAVVNKIAEKLEK